MIFVGFSQSIHNNFHYYYPKMLWLQAYSLL